MKILFVKDKRSISGFEGVANYLFCLCKYFNAEKIDYLVLYNDKDQFYKKLLEHSIKVKYVNFRVNSPKNIYRIIRIRKFLSKILNKQIFLPTFRYTMWDYILYFKKTLKYLVFLFSFCF